MLDFHGTLSENGEVSQDIVDLIKNLTGKGIHVAINSKAGLDSIFDAILSGLGQDFDSWEFLHFYTRDGRNGYGFDSDGKRVVYYETIESRGMIMYPPHVDFEYDALDKSLPVKHLMHMLEVAPEQIIAVGDNFSGDDRPMALPGVLAFDVSGATNIGMANVVSSPVGLLGTGLTRQILSTVLNQAAGHTYHILNAQEKRELSLPEGWDNLARDERDRHFFVYKPFDDPASLERNIENKVTAELFAWLYGRDLVNITEVRQLNMDYLSGTNFWRWWDKNIRWYQPVGTGGLQYTYDRREYKDVGLSRLASDYRYEDLVQKSGSLEGLIVFWTAIRDVNDHLYDPQTKQTLDLAVISRDGKEHFMSYDHGAAIPKVNMGLWDIQNFTKSILWSWVFKRDLDYKALAQTASQFKSRSPEEIRLMAQKAGFNAASLEIAVGNLTRVKDNLFSDLEHLIFRYTGKRVDLEGLLR